MFFLRVIFLLCFASAAYGTPIKNPIHNVAVKKDDIIFAYKVAIETINGTTAHVGYYLNAKILTMIDDPSGVFAKGTQLIILNNTPISIATTWTEEIVNDIEYIKHAHGKCYVYSTNTSQFVLYFRA